MENKSEESDLQLLYVLMQPTRQKIIRELKAAGEPLYIQQIADKIGESARNVSFHLATLAERGFVDGEYREIQAPTPNPGLGKAAKFYHLTEKYDETVRRFAKGIK
jgi:predicted ArsR family transcriptional regulator